MSISKSMTIKVVNVRFLHDCRNLSFQAMPKREGTVNTHLQCVIQLDKSEFSNTQLSICDMSSKESCPTEYPSKNPLYPCAHSNEALPACPET